MNAAQPGESAELARRVAPAKVSEGAERPITVDQTNVSVVVDEAVIVKWFVPPVPAPHPGVEVIDILMAAEFDEMPVQYGAHSQNGQVLATISQFIPGAVDGWTWFIDDLTSCVDGTVPADRITLDARRIGSLCARLHLAMLPARDFREDFACVADLERERARWKALLDEARSVTEGDAADVLAACETRIGAALSVSVETIQTPAIRLHGDLHVGQILRAGDELFVTDFDGNPLLEVAERRRLRPAAVDVASLVQSIDHAARVAQQRRPADRLMLGRLAKVSCSAMLDGYRNTLAEAGRTELIDDRLLLPMRVAQELHELVYAARHLPQWSFAPTATLQSMFPRPED